jgi:small neutral amino acid transporter SnatA (MarC family)
MSLTWLALFPILNPPAMAPVFLTLTSAVSDRDRNRLALLIGTYTALFLTILLLVGGWILKTVGISIPVVAIACGILLAGATVFVFYRFSGPVIRRLGDTGAATISQISAFVLLAIGVQIVWGGVKELLLATLEDPAVTELVRAFGAQLR